MRAKRTTEDFIIEAKSIFGDQYDYTETKYTGIYEAVTIICRKHGSFQQSAQSHLRGSGCARCKNSGRVKTTEQFIMDAKEVFGDLYDYSLVLYKGAISKVKIICNEHGEFEQTPHDHLDGSGCPRCKADTISRIFRGNLENFIIKANIVHSGKYSYLNSEYVNNFTKIEIICPSHGSFYQTPSNHLSEHGCPKCATSISKSEIRWLNVLGIPEKFRNKSIRINGKIFKVDAYNPDSNTVYEFYGDYWHGNLSKFNANDLNVNNKKTYGELYEATINREKLIKNAGYNIISIWESDFEN
jgi:hypothetical protein